MRSVGLVLALVLLVSCSDAPEPDEPADAAAHSTSASSEPSPSPTPSPTPEPEPTPTLPPVHHPVSLPALMREDFRAGRIQQQRVVAETDAYTRSEVTYGSGDLTISGVLLRPQGRGPFPGIVLNHGYIDPSYLRDRSGSGARAGLAGPGRVRGAAHRLPRARRLRPGPAAGPRGPARLRPRRDQRGAGAGAGAVRRPRPDGRCSAGRWAAGSP